MILRSSSTQLVILLFKKEPQLVTTLSFDALSLGVLGLGGSAQQYGGVGQRLIWRMCRHRIILDVVGRG
jgi:hypothetical protein